MAVSCLFSFLVCRTGQPIKLRLSNFTWKQLAGEPIGLEELKEVDDALHTSLSFAGGDGFDEVQPPGMLLGTVRSEFMQPHERLCMRPCVCSRAVHLCRHACMRGKTNLRLSLPLSPRHVRVQGSTVHAQSRRRCGTKEASPAQLWQRGVSRLGSEAAGP